MKRAPEGARKGVIAVEFAIILPFLLVLFLATFELGMLVRTHQILQNAAREGARLSANPENKLDPDQPSVEARIKQAVADYCNDQGIAVQTSDVTIEQNVPITVGARTMLASRITVTFSQTLITPGGQALTGGPVQLAGVAIFRNFYG